jgi:phosphatidate cytidylyltransferase
MLRTRLGMGALFIALTVAVLFGDRNSAGYPLWFALIAGLSAVATFELLCLMEPTVRPCRPLCFLGMLAMVLANFLPHFHDGFEFNRPLIAWPYISIAFAVCVMVAFAVEMATFREPGQSVTRIALAVWLFGYLGWLPSFLAQLHWVSRRQEECIAALALTIFVPKCCDIGAYFTGKLIGKHKMTPVLSPKKTWEGAAGGLAAAVLAAVALDRLGPAPLLRENSPIEIGFGLTVGVAGMLGDLAESLIKRDCRQKDASQVVPGFGGVLDVVDAILFAAPVAYVWFLALRSG